MKKCKNCGGNYPANRVQHGECEECREGGWKWDKE